MHWHVLDVGSVWLKEFASALSQNVATVCWQPRMSATGAWRSTVRESAQAEPPLHYRIFPLQKGYARYPLSDLLPFAPRLLRFMKKSGTVDGDSVLICTTPYYAPLAEIWPGSVVYYQTDLTIAYAGVDPRQVVQLDRRLCASADLVCPNSERIAEYFIQQAGCAASKIKVIPNATRAANVLVNVPEGPGTLPADLADLPRPVAGVIGNLAANMDWLFLRDLVMRTPQLSWALVGPTSMPVYEEAQREARAELLQCGGRVRFVGAKPYGELQRYARALDVAVLPYVCQEPTYSGSSTRFYEHLAACRPMIATRGFAELLSKEPLVRLVGDAAEATTILKSWQQCGFKDGQEQTRWIASQEGTWECRAETLVAEWNAKAGRSVVHPVPALAV